MTFQLVHVLMVFLLVFVVGWKITKVESKTGYLDLVVTSPLLSNIKTNDQIVGVKTFLTLFANKSRNDKLVQYLNLVSNNSSSNFDHDSNRNLLMEWLKTNSISIGVMTPHVNYLTTLFSYYNVSIVNGETLSNNTSTSNKYFKIYPSFDSCQKRNYLEKYDAVLLEPYAFTFFVRFYRDSSSLISSMESKNFIPVPLIPYEVYSRRMLETKSSDGMQELFNFEKSTTCENQPDVSDAQYFRLLTGYSNFSSQDVAIISRITSKSSLSANWTLINSNIPSILSSFELSETNRINPSSLSNLLLSSSCYMCSTSTCAGENFDPTLDYWIIPQFVIIFGYFILLFGFGIFKKPAMRRRIALPYCPILIMTLMVMFTSLSRICVCVFYNISTFAMIWWVFIYSATVIRFYYLRNLYSLITKFPKHEKLIKILASEKSGFMLTVVLTFFISLIFNSGGIYFFFLENKATIDTYRAAWVVGFFVLGGLTGFIAVIWDMIIHGKSIRKFGLRRFFFFDDPLYVRIDMFLLLFPLIIAILVATGSATLDTQQKEFENVSGIFNTILCFVFLTMNGGAVIMIEIYKRIRYSKSQIGNSDELEILLKNEDLFNLFKEYSEKEFSSENIEFYTVLLGLKVQKYLTVKDLDNIDDTFIKNYSKYEVNFPSSCKREFYKLKQTAEEKNQIEYSALWQVVGSDLVLNMIDTFKRLQETSNYRQWESVSKYQKHIHP